MTARMKLVAVAVLVFSACHPRQVAAQLPAPITLGDNAASDPYVNNPTGPYSGLIPRLKSSKLNDRLDVRDFGALGDNVHDDAPNINAAIAVAAARGGIEVFVPCSSTPYFIGSPIAINTPGVSFRGENSMCVKFRYPGSDVGVRIQMNPFSTTQSSYFGGFSIIGTSAGVAGLQTGCVVGGLFQNIFVTGFTGANSSGIDIQDRLDCFPAEGGAWTERTTWDNVWAGGAKTTIYPTDPYNTVGWKFETVGGPSNTSLGYNRFINVAANVHSGQIGFWFKTGVFMYNTDWTSTCNMDDGDGAFTTPPVCIQSDGNVSGNRYLVTGEYNGSHTAQSVHVTSGGTFWGWGTVQVFAPGGALIPGTYDGTPHQQQVARVTALNSFQSWDTGTGTINGVTVTPNIIASDNAGIANFGTYTGANVASPFLSILDDANNYFSICALAFNAAANTCIDPVNQALRLDPRNGLKIGAKFNGVEKPTVGLNPNEGAPNGFQFGLGLNCEWNGANWLFRGDTTNNGGACILGSNGPGNGILFYNAPTTGGANQIISNTTLQGQHLAARITGTGVMTPSPIPNEGATYNPSMSISGSTATHSAGFQNLELVGVGPGIAGDHFNEQLSVGDPNWQAGFGGDIGTDIAHPIAWGYSADPTIFEWLTKQFQTPLTSANSVAKMSRNGDIELKGHINQKSGNNNIAGTATGSATTTFAFTFTVPYNAAPICTATPTTVLAGIDYGIATSTTAATVTTSASTSATFNVICVGNPN